MEKGVSIFQKIFMDRKKEELMIRNCFKEVVLELLKYKNQETWGHLKRVRKYTEILGRKMMDLQAIEMDEKKLRMVAGASIYHDLGKLTVSDDILNKTGQLNKREYEIMKTHTVNGEEMIRKLKGIWAPEKQKIICNICRSHHERYDGSGYPDGLRGEEIPLEAQIVAVADVFDALVSKRVYKEAYVAQVALRMIKEGECGAFSDRILHSLDCAKEDLIEMSKRKIS